MKCTFKILIVLIFLHQTSNDISTEYALHIDADIDEARAILNEHCFTFKKHLASLGSYYLADLKNLSECLPSPEEHARLIKRQPKILWLEPQVGRARSKRNLADSDSLWYMNHRGRHQYDMQVHPVWRQKITGEGVVVSIIDDGVEKAHDDLLANYDWAASYDFVDDDSDPSPFPVITYNNHGTRCAGVVAGSGGKCAVGVAYHSRLGGIRVLSDSVKDSTEAQGILFKNDYISVYSASWGPLDDGKTMDGPHHLTQQAFAKAIRDGRDGKGSIYVWASGNGGYIGDSCMFDGYVNLIGTLVVGSISIEGTRPSYLEMCAGTLISTLSGGLSYGISTTDIENSCTGTFSGTSASAPMAAGIVAMGLETRPDLTWRDVQHIALRATVTEFIQDGEWVVNSVGRKYSHKYGYGLVTAARYVELALKWPGVGDMHVCTGDFGANGNFTDSRSFSFESAGCANTQDHVVYLENVQFKVTMSAQKRGCLRMTAHSPSRTESTIIFTRPLDNGFSFVDWPLLSVAFWGEKANGTWTVTVTNTCSQPTHVDSVSLVMHGTVDRPPFISKHVDDIDCPSLVHVVEGRPTCVHECPSGYCDWLFKCVLCDPPSKADCALNGVLTDCPDVDSVGSTHVGVFVVLFTLVFLSSMIFVCKYVRFSCPK